MNKILPTIVILLLLAILAVQLQAEFKPHGGNKAQLAALYQAQGLPAAAAKAYLELAGSELAPPHRAANAAYLAGKIFQEELASPQSALQAFFLAQHLGLSGKLKEQLERRIIRALEESGRMSAALLALKKKVDLKKAPPSTHQILAQVGQAQITNQDLERHYRTLKSQGRKQPAPKIALQQLIFRQLLLHKAVRSGLFGQPKIRQQLDDYKLDLATSTLLNELVDSKIQVTDKEVSAAQAKPNRSPEKPGAGPSLHQQLWERKRQAAYQKLYQQLSTAEDIKTYYGRLD